jgi:hypothetical protein
MARKAKKMLNKHNFPIRRVNPINGRITMETMPHTVMIPGEELSLFITEEGVLRSKKLRGRGNSAACTGSLCVYQQREVIDHPVTGVTDFLYSRVFIQSDDKKKICYGYEHSDAWFPKMNDLKGGHDQILKKIRENGGPILIKLRPIANTPPHDRVGNINGSMPRRSSKKRGAHLRAMVGAYGIEVAYSAEE